VEPNVPALVLGGILQELLVDVLLKPEIGIALVVLRMSHVMPVHVDAAESKPEIVDAVEHGVREFGVFGKMTAAPFPMELERAARELQPLSDLGQSRFLTTDRPVNHKLASATMSALIAEDVDVPWG
jgi:hypothetical protein